MEINFDKAIFLAQRGDELAAPNLETNVAPENSAETQQQSLLSETESAPVTIKEFSHFQTETNRQLEELKTLTEEKTSLFGIDTGNILLGVLGVELFILFAVIFFFMKTSQLADQSNKMVKQLSAQKEKIDALTSELEKVKRNAAQTPSIAPAADILSKPKPAEIQSFSEIHPIEKPVAAPRQVTPEDKFKDFVKDFNALAGLTGFDLKESKANFQKKYKIQMFTCANFEARMNEPIPKPIFDSANAQTNPDYWAYEFEPGVFAAVPNVKTYSDNCHTARAMGDLFASNFIAGRTYNRIRVNKPAIFRGMWNLEKQGELELS